MTLRILQVHNRYTSRGGEDVVADQERAALLSAGLFVERVEVQNDGTLPSVLSASVAPFWSPGAFRRVRAAVEEHQADVVHVHNTHAQLGPAALFGARAAGAAVVWTAHNFRAACSNALLLRDGVPCERCLGGNHLHAVRYACYRSSYAASAVMASSLFLHQRLKTMERAVDRVLCVSSFVRDVLVRSGMDPGKLLVKPNVVQDLRHVASGSVERRNAFVFVGRLAPEKGVRLLIDAWRAAALEGWRLRIVGDGPDRHMLEAAAQGLGSIEFTGWLDRPAVADAMASARYLVAPSLGYEAYALGVTEAQSLGTPAIAPAHGPFLERVRDGETGSLFQPGDRPSLEEALVKGARAVHEGSWAALSRHARLAYESDTPGEAGVPALVAAYEAALGPRRAAVS